MAERTGLPSLTGALPVELTGHVRRVWRVLCQYGHDSRRIAIALSEDSLCLPGGLRGPSNLGVGTIGPICGCPLLVPFCGPRPFGTLRFPLLACLKGVSTETLLPAATPFRICVGAPLLNMLGGCCGRQPAWRGDDGCRPLNVGSRPGKSRGAASERAGLHVVYAGM